MSIVLAAVGVLAAALQGPPSTDAQLAPETAHRDGASQADPASATQAAGNGSPTQPQASEVNRDPHGPQNVDRYITSLESAERDSFQKPEEVIAALGLHPAAVVADLGCGPGYFTRRLAKAVPNGLVYAVDVEPRQLYRLHEHLRAEGLHNVVPVLASLADPHLPPGQIDLILVVDTYHHFDDRMHYLSTLTRTLKPNGHLVIIDYYKRALPVGPPSDHKIARDDIVREVEEAGYRLEREPTFLPYQYFLVFGRADAATPPAPSTAAAP